MYKLIKFEPRLFRVSAEKRDIWVRLSFLLLALFTLVVVIVVEVCVCVCVCVLCALCFSLHATVMVELVELCEKIHNLREYWLPT